MDLLTVLTNYLATHKRLVVPQLGVFLVKEPGKSVVFSELMKRDDGVLRGLLCAEGLSEVEAAGRIDRLVFEVRQAVERGASYPLAGLGTMQPGPNGTIAFVYASAAQPEAAAEMPVAPEIPETPVASAPAEAAPAAGEPAPVSPQPETPAPAAEPVSSEPDAVPKRPEAPSHIDTARMAETMRTAFRQETPAADPEADDEPAAKPRAAAPQPAPAPRRKPAYTLEEAYADHKAPKRKIDRFLLMAIVAGILAIAAIAFGFWREMQEERAAEESLSNDIEWTGDVLPEE